MNGDAFIRHYIGHAIDATRPSDQHGVISVRAAVEWIKLLYDDEFSDPDACDESAAVSRIRSGIAIDRSTESES